MTDKVVVLVTCGKAREARQIAMALVESRLAACVNVIPKVRSYYRWGGKIQSDAEILLVIKTARARFAELCREIEKRHSYKVPEMICLPIVEGADAYLHWLEESVRPRGPRPGRR